MIEQAILDLLNAPGGGKSIAPEQAARAVAGEDWRARLPEVRAVAVSLAQSGRLVIVRHGRPVDPNAFKGVYRLALPMRAGAQPVTDGPGAS